MDDKSKPKRRGRPPKNPPPSNKSEVPPPSNPPETPLPPNDLLQDIPADSPSTEDTTEKTTPEVNQNESPLQHPESHGHLQPTNNSESPSSRSSPTSESSNLVQPCEPLSSKDESPGEPPSIATSSFPSITSAPEKQEVFNTSSSSSKTDGAQPPTPHAVLASAKSKSPKSNQKTVSSSASTSDSKANTNKRLKDDTTKKPPPGPLVENLDIKDEKEPVLTIYTKDSLHIETFKENSNLAEKQQEDNSSETQSANGLSNISTQQSTSELNILGRELNINQDENEDIKVQAEFLRVTQLNIGMSPSMENETSKTDSSATETSNERIGAATAPAPLALQSSIPLSSTGTESKEVEKEDEQKEPIIPKKPDFKIAFVSRREWGAQPPVADVEPLRLPVGEIVYTCSTGTDPCTSREQCLQTVREIQLDILTKTNLPDIPYHFLVGGDRTVYEGRGWLMRSERPNYMEFVEGSRLDMAFIGRWTTDTLPSEMLKTAKCFIYHNMARNRIMERYKEKVLRPRLN